MKPITNEFAQKILCNYGVYDTRKYRYFVRERSWGLEASRIPRESLGTLAAYHPEYLRIVEAKNHPIIDSVLTYVEHGKTEYDVYRTFEISWSNGTMRKYRRGLTDRTPRFITNFCTLPNITRHKVSDGTLEWRLNNNN